MQNAENLPFLILTVTDMLPANRMKKAGQKATAPSGV